MLWSGGFREDVVQVNFCPVENGEEGECVVEVAVNQYPDLSFFDKDGPRSYKLNGNKPSPYGLEEWRKLMSATTTEEKDSKQQTKAKKREGLKE
nr:hypothetical protein BaRGS_020951 [Batillaria attramentaria]